MADQSDMTEYGVWQPISTVQKTGGRLMLGLETGPYVILIRAGNNVPIIGFWNGFAFDDGDFNSGMDGFTHWMPLPPAPTPKADR